MRFDNKSTIPKEEKYCSKHDTQKTIKDVNSVFKYTLNRDILNVKYIIEKERKLGIE